MLNWVLRGFDISFEAEVKGPKLEAKRNGNSSGRYNKCVN